MKSKRTVIYSTSLSLGVNVWVVVSRLLSI